MENVKTLKSGDAKQWGLVALIVATVTEFAGLFFWVQLVDAQKNILGIIVLVIGLLAERIAVYITIRERMEKILLTG